MYRELVKDVLEELGVEDLYEAWSRLIGLVRLSREYVLLKFMAQLHVLLDERVYNELSELEKDFLSRDLLVLLHKVRQLKQMFAGGESGNHVAGAKGPNNPAPSDLRIAEPRSAGFDLNEK